MADSSKMLLLGGAAAVAYWYFYMRTPTAAAAPVTTTGVVPVVPVVTTPVVPVTPVTPVTTPAAPAAPAKPKLSDIQAATILAANAPSVGLPVDNWGWYLNNALAPYGLTAPDPVPLFTALVNAANTGAAALAAANGTPYTPVSFNRGDNVTTATYWGVMGPALQSQLGLSGLGMFRGRW